MEIPRHWRLKAQRYRLEGSVCPLCQRLVFPPRRTCSCCHNQLAGIITGAMAAPGKRMVHSGAIFENGSGSAADKINKLRNVGIRIASHPEEIQTLLER